MDNHLSEDDLILHYYGETERGDEARIASHLAACAACQGAKQKLARVMTLVDSAAPVEAPLGFERTAWARLEPLLDDGAINRSASRDDGRVHRSAEREGGWRTFFWFPQWALAGGVAALVIAAFAAGRFSGGDTTVTSPAQVVAADGESSRVLQAEVGDHLDRTQMMLVELVNAETDHSDVLASEQARASDLVAVNRLIRQSAAQSGDGAIVSVLEDLERVLLEIANAPANASSNDLTDLQSRITTEDLLFRLRVIASEMRQRTLNGRATGDRLPAKKMPVS